MFWFGIKEVIEKHIKKTKITFSKFGKDTDTLKLLIEDQQKQITELKETIPNIIKQQIDSQLREVQEKLREPATQKDTRSNLKPLEKRALKVLDKAKLQKAIVGYIEDNYTTNQIKEEIINRFNIKPTCFYKYLKVVRQKLHELAPPKAPRSN